MIRSPAVPGGSLALDGEGLAKATLRDRTVTGWLVLAHADDLRVINSAAALVEVVLSRKNRPAQEWTLSRQAVEPITEPTARHVAAPLADTDLHGHAYAVGAMLAATALAAPGRPQSPPPIPRTPPLCAADAPPSSRSDRTTP